MANALSADIRALLDRPNFAHLATLMPDGAPHSAPAWVTREDDRILVTTGEGSLKARNTRRDPRVALSITDLADPYSEAQLRGRVVEWRPDRDFVAADAALPFVTERAGGCFIFTEGTGAGQPAILVVKRIPGP